MTLADDVAALRAEREALQQRIHDYSHPLESLTQTLAGVGMGSTFHDTLPLSPPSSIRA